MRSRRLLWRLFGAYMLVVTAALLVSAWFASTSLRQAFLLSVQENLETAAHLAEKDLGDVRRDEAPRLQAVCDTIGHTAGVRITLILPNGQVLCDTQERPDVMENHADRPEIIEAIKGSEGIATRFSGTLAQQMLYVAVPVVRSDQVAAVVRAALPLATIDRDVHRVQWKIFIGAGIALLGAALAALLAARWISQPIEELRRGVQLLAVGQLGERLVVPEGQELGELAALINEMADQLEERSHAIGRQGHEQQAVLASMVEGVLAVDSHERVISLNRAAAELIGGQQDDLFGRSLQEIIRNADLRRFASRALVCDEPIEDDVVLHGDADRVLRARGTSLRDARGAGVGAVIVLNDVTTFRRLENLRRDFVANVSHELKTPIASIKGFVETLLDGALHDPQDAERFLRIVAKQADRLNSIIEDLLSLSKIEQSEEASDLALQPGRIKDVLDAAISDCQSLAEDRQIQVRSACPAELEARINPPLLEQALINLIDNAIKYSEPGSEVLVTAEVRTQEVSIAVEDHGCGVEKEHLPRLFERFYRVDRARSRKLGGTGLGLAIVKHIVQAHRGRITVVSTPGQGSTFTIHLPREPGATS